MHDVAWRGMWIYVRSKDAQKQLAQTLLKFKFKFSLFASCVVWTLFFV